MTKLKLYNTASKTVEPLVPFTPGVVTMYTCGPTVYLDPHIGNWRTFIFYDTLSRVIKNEGLDLTHVLNITDVGHLVSDDDEGEDKLAKIAKTQRKTAWEVAEIYTQKFLEGIDALNIARPNYLPKATDHIEEQIALIVQLEAKGYTYRIDDGIYFDTSLLDDYGKLANLDNVELLEGARVEANAQKRYKTDFALWKFSPPDAMRDMEWDSPWGRGFPGWHIECSAMAVEYLGVTMDIHAGGVDHIPIHHTNEIAQSEAATGEPFANMWLHSEFMLVDNAKMAKSEGNGYTLDDIAARNIDPMAFRLLILQSHYRTQSNFTWEALEAAANRLHDIYTFADLIWQLNSEVERPIASPLPEMKEAIRSDLNTPKAFAALSSYMNELGTDPLKKTDVQTHRKILAYCDAIFGLDLLKRKDITSVQKQLIHERLDARKNSEWSLADKLRDQLLRDGIALRDIDSTTSIWSRC